jgi:hypothetical protein
MKRLFLHLIVLLLASGILPVAGLADHLAAHDHHRVGAHQQGLVVLLFVDRQDLGDGDPA